LRSEGRKFVRLILLLLLLLLLSLLGYFFSAKIARCSKCALSTGW